MASYLALLRHSQKGTFSVQTGGGVTVGRTKGAGRGTGGGAGEGTGTCVHNNIPADQTRSVHERDIPLLYLPRDKVLDINR